MNMLPSEPPIIKKPSTEQQLIVKKHRKQETTSRSVWYAIITAAIGALLAFAAGGSLLTIVASFIISGILGIAFAIIQSFDQRVMELENTVNDAALIIKHLRNDYVEEITRLNAENILNGNNVSKLMGEFDGLVRNAATALKFYSTIRSVLDGDYAQKQLIRRFLNEVMSRPIFTQPMKEGVFYELVENGFEQCTASWQAIHQGPISDLPHFSYLQQLKETGKPLKKQRIVILNEEECKELEDDNKVDRFLRDTDGTESYWIKEDVFYKKFDVPSKMRLDDAALHDGKLLILRHRETQLTMLALEGQGDRAYDGIINAFNSLNLDIKHQQLGGTFKAIERAKRPEE